MKKFTLLAVVLLVAANALNAGWGDKPQAEIKKAVNKAQENTKQNRDKVKKQLQENRKQLQENRKQLRKASRDSKKAQDVVPMP